MSIMDKCVRSVLCPILVMLLSMATLSLVHAQEVRIGYVDMKRVLDNAPQVLAGRTLLDQEFRARNDSIELDESRLNLMESQLAQADMTSDERWQEALMARKVDNLFAVPDFNRFCRPFADPAITDLKIEDVSGTEVVTRELTAGMSFVFYSQGYGKFIQ